MSKFVNSILNFKTDGENHLCFYGHKLSIHSNDNSHIKNENFKYVNAWCYDQRKGGMRLEKLTVNNSKQKGLYITKYGKRQYLNDMKTEVLRPYYPNRKVN